MMSEGNLFFSYNWGENRKNVDKVRDMYDQVKKEIENVNIWWDQNELKVDDWKKKIFEGISNSDIFVAFMTSKYCSSENAKKELDLAVGLKKQILFFINENVENMSHQQIIKDIFNEAAFDLGNKMYFKTKEQLITAIKIKLADLKKTNVIKFINVIITCSKSSFIF